MPVRPCSTPPQSAGPPSPDIRSLHAQIGTLIGDVDRERRRPHGRMAARDMDGMRLKPEKGINFPDTDLGIPALTAKDRTDLAFVAAHADGVEFSFVQTAADVTLRQQALAEHRPSDWRSLSLILKIETVERLRALGCRAR